MRHYTHFSLAMSASRRFCRWVAWNIDGNGAPAALPQRTIEFGLDPAYDAEYQVDDDLYASNRLDRGHIARRADLLWGQPAGGAAGEQRLVLLHQHHAAARRLQPVRASTGSGASSRTRSSRTSSVDDLGSASSAGRSSRTSDLPYRDMLVPRSFWKVDRLRRGGAAEGQGVRADPGRPRGQAPSLGLEQFNLYQVAIGDLTGMTGLDFGDLPRRHVAAHPGALAPGVRRIDARSQSPPANPLRGLAAAALSASSSRFAARNSSWKSVSPLHRLGRLPLGLLQHRPLEELRPGSGPAVSSGARSRPASAAPCAPPCRRQHLTEMVGGSRHACPCRGRFRPGCRQKRTQIVLIIEVWSNLVSTPTASRPRARRRWRARGAERAERRIVVGGRRWHDVVVEAAVLVVGDHEQGLRPLRAGTIAWKTDETRLLPRADVGGRVVVVRAFRAVADVDEVGVDPGDRGSVPAAASARKLLRPISP